MSYHVDKEKKQRKLSCDAENDTTFTSMGNNKVHKKAYTPRRERSTTAISTLAVKVFITYITMAN